jgi:hypothetical protein
MAERASKGAQVTDPPPSGAGYHPEHAAATGRQLVSGSLPESLAK